MVHIVYCNTNEIDKILEGSKTMIIRGAEGRKVPHSRVFIDETLYFMDKNTKTIVASAEVTDVQNYVKLKNDEITEVMENNDDKLLLSEDEKKHWHKRCLCLIEFANAKAIEPLNYNAKSTLDNWQIKESLEEVLAS